MYPLILIFGYAIYKKNRELVWPALVLVPIGWLIAVYHNLLYYNILPDAAAPCVAGISCTTKFTGILHAVPIPLQALIGFTIILVSLIIYWRTSKGEQTTNV